MKLLGSNASTVFAGSLLLGRAYATPFTVGERNLVDDGEKIPCFEVQILKCSFLENEGQEISCDDWREGIHGCAQSAVTIGYSVKNIATKIEANVASELEAKILAGFGPIMTIPFVVGLSNSDGFNLKDVILPGGLSINGNQEIKELDFCDLDKEIGIYITGGVAGGETLDAKKCKSASDSISAVIPVPPSLSPAPSGKGKGKSKGNDEIFIGGKSGKGGKGKKANLGLDYFEYECSNGDALSLASASPSASPSSQSSPKTPPKRRIRQKVTKSPRAMTKTSPSITTHSSYAPESDRLLEKDTQSISPSPTKKAKSKKGNTGTITGFDDTLITKPTPKNCELCIRMMQEPTKEPRSRPLDNIYYSVKIIKSQTATQAGDKEIEMALMEVMNGFFKAKLLGCIEDDSARRRLEVTMIDMTSADFDKLNIGGRGGIGLCDGSEPSTCKAAEGRLKVYFESSGNDRNTDKAAVTWSISTMLSESANEIASYIEEVEELEFMAVSSNRSEILPPRSIVQSAWVVFPVIAATMLIIYGVMISIRENRKTLYKNLDEDEMKGGLFAPDDKVRSNDGHFPTIVEIKWENVQVVYDHGVVEDHDIYNRESLSRAATQFQMPTADQIDNGAMDNQPDNEYLYDQ